MLFSCKKDTATVSSINFSGSIKDSSNLEGIANVHVKMYWFNLQTYEETQVDSTVTDTQGHYTINTNIDKSKFKTHLLNVAAVVPNAYISPLDLDNRETGQSILGIQSDKIQLLDLYLYKKALLDISLKKTTNDSLSGFELSYGYQGPYGRRYWLIAEKSYSSIPAGDTILHVITAAAMSTKVEWNKHSSNGSILSFKDTIICKPGINNIININY
jgi:hypothetical protein